MNFFVSTVVLLTTLTPFAHAESGAWSCRVEGEPSGQSVRVELPGPTLTYILHATAEDGTTTDVQQELITATTVSSYKADRTKCVENAASSGDGLRYSYRFSCGSIYGALQFRAETRDGAYFQQLGSTGPQRAISFSACERLDH